MTVIALFADHFHPFIGGLEMYCLSLAKGLSQKHTVHVFTYRFDNSPHYELYEGIHIHRLESKEILKNTFRVPVFWHGELAQLKKRLTQLKVKVVISNTRFFTSSWLASHLSKSLKLKYIHVEHGNRFVTHANPIVTAIAWLVDQTFGRSLLKNAYKVVVISDPGIKFVQKLGVKNQKKIVKIPNCIDTSRFTNAQPIALSEKPVVLYIGRLIYAKGVQHLIEAMKIFPDMQLVIIGDGPYRADLERLANGAALFVGSKTPSEIPRYLASTSIFVNPSYSEGLPTSVMEAGSAGIPVIATDVGGTKEIIPNNSYGWLIPAQSTDAIVQALKEAKAVGAHERAMKLKSYIKKKFDVTVLVKSFEKLLKQ